MSLHRIIGLILATIIFLAFARTAYRNWKQADAEARILLVLGVAFGSVVLTTLLLRTIEAF